MPDNIDNTEALLREALTNLLASEPDLKELLAKLNVSEPDMAKLLAKLEASEPDMQELLKSLEPDPELLKAHDVDPDLFKPIDVDPELFKPLDFDFKPLDFDFKPLDLDFKPLDLDFKPLDFDQTDELPTMAARREIQMIFPQCFECRHLDRSAPRLVFRCTAFAEIPMAIMTAEHDHREPYPGDNGIRFEPRQATGSELPTTPRSTTS